MKSFSAVFMNTNHLPSALFLDVIVPDFSSLALVFCRRTGAS